MGFCDSTADRAQARLTALAAVRALVPAMFGRNQDDNGMQALMLYLAQDLTGDGEHTVSLIAAYGQLVAALTWRLAAERAGRTPSEEEVTAVYDELERTILAAEDIGLG